ncbi:beta-galactosidase [Dictyobacter sp. S3.2.2.5]|uniref:Beta-galactosidase n=1 Tax=Dictyobacter halimunensis TaxID=3026934 RepID=A0ABQ6FRG7_9CHLR|nr:beta-galactosidase [Dictyobacter sp. S3.2.2.5]
MHPFPAVNSRAPFIWHGGDYNPEQWPRDIWDQDISLMQESHFRVPTVGVFSWVSLQPEEERFTFEWLDTILDKLANSGRLICLATPTAAQPAWMSQRYPDVLRSDDKGIRNHHGRRGNYCPTSPTYRRFAVQIAERMAERYAKHPALLIWHVCNEYGGACYCSQCATEFRNWLQKRYSSLDDLNQKWWTPFWGHTYTDWSQIEPPYANGERAIHALTLDYKRFQSDMLLQCFQLERDAIRKFSPDIPITTNMMGTYPGLDYRKWAKEVDVISWDCYPAPKDHPSDIAFLHDLNRGLRDNQPFLLMEQTPSSQNWQAVNALKRPGILRLWSYLAVAHGADAVMYFQWRRGRGGCEKMHGAVVEHSGRADTRVFREVSQLGAELEHLKDRTIGGVTHSRVAMLFDWDNWWAIEDTVGPVRDKQYIQTLRQHYAALWKQHVSVDIVFSDSDISTYDVLIAPMLYMLKPGVAERIEAFVSKGGSFIATYFTGYVNEYDLANENGYPGPLSHVLGIWNEEIDALYPEQSNKIVMNDGSGKYVCNHLCEIIHCEGATPLATYATDFYAGSPVVTRNSFGRGNAYYIASRPEQSFLDAFYAPILAEHHIAPTLTVPAGVEIAQRETAQGTVLFLLNHATDAVQIPLQSKKRFLNLLNDQTVQDTITLTQYDVAILTAIDDEKNQGAKGQ